MTASINTIQQIYKVLLKYLAADLITAVISDLQQVQGNKSFLDTIDALEQLHKQNLRQMRKR